MVDTTFHNEVMYPIPKESCQNHLLDKPVSKVLIKREACTRERVHNIWSSRNATPCNMLKFHGGVTFTAFFWGGAINSYLEKCRD